MNVEASQQDAVSDVLSQVVGSTRKPHTRLKRDSDRTVVVSVFLVEKYISR